MRHLILLIKIYLPLYKEMKKFLTQLFLGKKQVMENQTLYNLYQDGRHWEKRPAIYAERYAAFLQERWFTGQIVDLGCGAGRDAAVFHRQGLEVLGIDISAEEISKAQLNHPSCKFEVQDVQALAWADNSVAAYFMINVIHYLNQQQALNEIHRTLRLGGYLFIHFNLDITDEEGNNDYHHDEKDIARLVSKFKIVERRKFERVDSLPKIHTHQILELILQK